MTIKQQGGVFGRNPSFNDVEANDLIAGNVEIPQGGKLYIGNGAPGGALPRGDLEIYHNGSNSYIDEVYNGNLLIRAHSRIQFQGYVSGKNFIIMDDGGAVSLWHNGANKLQTTSTGIGVTGNVALTDGGGIDFSATAGTGTSELFDDYEEGTFSPIIEGTSTSGTYSYGSQVGQYTKIGNAVRINITLQDITADVAGTGSLKISGLPFSADGVHVAQIWARTLNFDNATAYLIAYTSGSDMFIQEVIDASAGSSVNVADISSGNTRLYITLTYKV